MIGLKTRRQAFMIGTMLSIVVVVMVDTWYRARLGRADFFSGYVLLAASVGLLLLSIRKRLIVLPLGQVSLWLQMHQYLGIFALATFVMHVRLPVRGNMECLLALVFLLISASGLLGWYLNRTTPKRLLATGRDYMLADIPRLRFRIGEQAYAVALTAAGKIESATLAEHYTQFLSPFFQRPRSLTFVLAPNGSLRRTLLHGLDQLDRYLGPHGQTARAELSQLVKEKDDLDFHQALQSRLRLWIVGHVSLVWIFILLTAMHVVMVHQFHGS